MSLSILSQEEVTDLPINAWTVQNIVYELITSFFLRNTPKSLDIPLPVVYDSDKSKTDIYVAIAYNYDAQVVGKRPAIFIRRGDQTMKPPTFAATIGNVVVKESETPRLFINQLPITVSVIAAPIMMTELMAEYAKYALQTFQYEIQEDFHFRKFRVVSVSAPEIYKEAKEYFIINIALEVAYDEGWVVKGDDLRLNSVAFNLYESVSEVLFNAQV